jgi:DNA-binding IclR family transcriptional regulator
MVSSYQACILLQFNGGSDSLSYQELQTGTSLNDETLKAQLAQLVKQKVLTQEDDQYDLNLKFQSKKVCAVAVRRTLSLPFITADPSTAQRTGKGRV